MGAIGSFGGIQNTTGIKPVKNPVNTTVTTSGTPSTETSFVLSVVKRFRITNRGSTVLQFAYQPGDSGTNYASIFPGGSEEEVNIDDQTITIYVQTASASQRLEVVSWS